MLENVHYEHSLPAPDTSDAGVASEASAVAVDPVYHAYFQAIPDAVLVFSLGPSGPTRFAEVSDEAVRRYGYSRDEMLSMGPGDLIEPGSLDFAQFMASLQTTGRAIGEAVHLAKDGRRIPVESLASLVRRDGQELVVSVCRDASERLRSEAWRLQQAQVWDTLRDSPIVISSVNRELRYDLIHNPILGVESKGAIGASAEELAEALGGIAGVDDLSEFKLRVMQSGQPDRKTIIIGEGSDARHFDVIANPRRGATGEIDGVVSVSVDVTDRARAEAALRHSEERFRNLADAMPQLVWTANASGDVEYYNSRIEQYGGHVFRDGRWNWEPLVHAGDLDRTAEAWNDAVATGTPYSIEHRVQMADGSYRWHLSRSHPAVNMAGEVVRWYGTATDIHDLKSVEAELEGARDRLAIALEAAEMGIWTSNFPASHTDRSLRHDQIFGYESLQPEWNLDVARAHVLEEDLERFDRAVLESRESGVLRHEVRVRWPDGQIRWIYSLGRFYYSDDGAAQGMAGVVMDITERKRVEEALRDLNDRLEDEIVFRTSELIAARDHFQTAFHASPVATTIERLRDGALLDVNQEFAGVFGYSPAGKTDGSTGAARLDLWVRDSDHEHLLADLRAGVSVRDRELKLQLASGDVRTMLVSAEPMEVHEELAALVMYLDITARKQAEAAVRQLTTALTLAEQRERRRLSQVLHDDLQQILFGIDMRAAVLEHALSTFAGADVTSLQSHVEDIRGLLIEAIHSTRVLSLELNPPVLRGEGLGPALGWLARHMEEMHGLRVEVQLDDELPLPNEDQRVLVVQLARELLFNVVKHAGVQEARLSAEAPDGQLVISVQDAGSGFDVIEQLDNSLHRDSLGLYSVTERLRLFGGTLRVDSAPGIGTRVHLVLPLHAPVVAPEPQKSQK